MAKEKKKRTDKDGNRRGGEAKIGQGMKEKRNRWTRKRGERKEERKEEKGRRKEKYGAKERRKGRNLCH